MDIVTILRELRRRRRAVIVAFLVAVFAAVLVMYQVPGFKSRSHDVGVATTQILLDTPSSQVVAVAPKGSDTLGMRANLLASLMVQGDVEGFIARRAGLQPKQIGGSTDAATDVSPGSSLAASPGPTASRPYALTTHILSDATNMPLPIIRVDVQAPTADAAARLAQAAVLGLKDYLNTTAAQESIPDVQRLQVEGLGVPQGATVTQGPTSTIAILVAMFVFVLGCASILGSSALRRRWRAADEREALEAQGLLPREDAEQVSADAKPATPDTEREAPVHAGFESSTADASQIAAAAQSLGERRPAGESLLTILRRSGHIEPGDADGDSPDAPEGHGTEAPDGTEHRSAAHPGIATRRAFYFSIGHDS